MASSIYFRKMRYQFHLMVSNTLFEEVEDMSDYLKQINEIPGEESDDE